MFPFEFIILLAALAFLVIAFVFKDYVFGAISGMLIMLFGVYIATSGLMGFTTFLVQGLGVVSIGVGAYVFIRGGVEALRG